MEHRGGYLYLFPKCIDSVVSAVRGMPGMEIVIADWNSIGWRLNEWVHDKIKELSARSFFTRVLSTELRAATS
jgi:hypothetical protein